MLGFCPFPELMVPIAWCQELELVLADALWNLQGVVRVR